MGKKILHIFMALIIVISAISLAGCSQKASDFSEEEHIQRISDLVKKRYISNLGEYTNFEVYPLFSESDKLTHFLVEFEPSGFVYVQLNENSPYASMYTRDAGEGEPWRRYSVEKDIKPTPTMPNKNGVICVYLDRRWEIDKNGDYIDYNNSHFKVANILKEKRYLLKINQENSNGYIPAIKRGNNYLNLMSMEEMEYQHDVETRKFSTSDIGFIMKKTFNL